jgi:voltage-gated potassium channel
MQDAISHTEGSLRNKLFRIIDGDPEYCGRIGRALNIFLMLLIISNVLAVILESVHPFYLAYKDFFILFEIFSIVVFSVEYLLRLWTIPEDPFYQGAISGRWRYARTPMAIIDLLAILPFYLPFIFALDLRFLRILRLFRLFRLFKLARYSSALSMIYRTVVKNKEILVSAFVILLILLVLSSSLMYHVEYDAQPDAFDSIPSTMWWAIATLTTVGYGDIYPITPLGKLLGGFVAILGIAMFAIPTGVLATGFMEEIQGSCKKGEENDTVDLLERLHRLHQEGALTDEEFQEQKRKVLELLDS